MRNEIEMMRVLRVPPLGKLVVEVNEARVEHLSEVADPKIRQRLLTAVGELIDFCGGYAVLENAGVAPQLTLAAPPRTEEEKPTAVPPELAQQQEEFLATLENQVEEERHRPVKQAPGILPLPTPTLNQPEPIVTFTEDGDVKPAAPPSRPPSIAEQIDAIVQKHVANTPSLAGRSIRLEQNVTGGLVILVDGQAYEKPTDIEDAEVQAVIKTAVREWNATQ
jgi:hypothetical protein